MATSATQTATESYSTADIENVVRRFTTDLRMIAESSGSLSRSEAEDYGEDIEYLAKKKLLRFVDVTLFVNGEEEKAVRYTVTTSGDLKASRPGGVLWPRKSGGYLSIVVRPTQSFWSIPSVMNALNISWAPTNKDISHSTLKASQGRAYVSNGFAFNREDYSK
jgi:Bacterial HORMA domain family 1